MKNIILLLAIFFCVQRLGAQGSSFTISYPIGFATGSDFKNYIGQTSFRGISLEFNKRQGTNLDLGLELGWNVFYQRQDSKAYTEGTTSISGVQYRNTNIVPIIAGAKYFIGEDPKSHSKVSPYVGAGLGTIYVERATDMGLYRLSTDTWQFCIRPEAGVLFHVDPSVSILGGVKYYAAFETDDLAGQSYLTVNIGVVFKTHH